MAHTVITVDGITLLDEDLGEWQQQPPPELDAIMRPAEPQPWSKPVLVTLVDGLLTNRPSRIDVTTRPHGWAMTVNHHD